MLICLRLGWNQRNNVSDMASRLKKLAFSGITATVGAGLVTSYLLKDEKDSRVRKRRVVRERL